MKKPTKRVFRALGQVVGKALQTVAKPVASIVRQIPQHILHHSGGAQEELLNTLQPQQNSKKGNLALYDVLSNGYNATGSRKGNLHGYVLDNDLSDKNNQVYYHPKKKKLLYNVNGTSSAGDWITNAKLGLGIGYKESNRYKQSHAGLRKAKEKYHVANATVTGHSQGGLTANYISSKGDNVMTLNAAGTIGSRLRRGKHYRNSGDVVSALHMGKKHTVELRGAQSLLKTGSKALTAYNTGNGAVAMSAAKDVLDAHKVTNIQNKPIFIS